MGDISVIAFHAPAYMLFFLLLFGVPSIIIQMSPCRLQVSILLGALLAAAGIYLVEDLLTLEHMFW